MTNQNRGVVEQVLDAAAQGDLGRFAELLEAHCARDLVVHEAGSLPYGGTHYGVSGFMTLLAEISGYIDATSMVVEAIAGDGDNVVLRARSKWIAPPYDEAPLEIVVSEWWTFRDGKVVEVMPFYFDTAALLDAKRRADSANPTVGTGRTPTADQ